VSIFFTLDSSIPTTNSTLYSAPFVLTNTAVVKARAFKDGAVDSQMASATFYNVASLGNGTGLTGNYWSNQLKTFNGSPTLTRVDATVNFDWSNGAPDPGISADHFTVRWLGDVQPLFSETYTFYTTTDDGVRLWVNNQLIVDKWVDQGATEWSGTIALAAGNRYPVKMEYYENGGSASAKLAWSSPSTSKAIIPQTQLYPSNFIAPPFFTGTPRFVEGQFQLQLSGVAGLSYVLQATTNFTSWTSLSTNVAPSNVFDLFDPDAGSFPLRFYRAVGQP
jgi:hypothetical protein